MATSCRLRAFLRAHRHTRRLQDGLLRRLIIRHRETAFGADHGFAAIDSYEDFTRAVPIGDYETLRPYIDRTLAGETTALFPAGENVLMFSMTSGTTGRPKHIPVTSTFARHMKRTFSIFGYKAICDHRDVWLRPILTISSPTREGVSPSGLPCGAISGLLRDRQHAIVRRMYAAPPQASAIANPAAKFYTILRCSIDKDVSFITTANPSSVVKLIETGQQHVEQLLRDVADGTFTPPGTVDVAVTADMRLRPNPALARRLEDGIARDGELLPGHFWDLAFLANWTGGTLKLYLPRLRRLFGDVPVRDIGLVASEGRFSIPLADGTPAGVAEITGNFLEFIPADQYDSLSPNVLRAHELEVGQEYFLVVTNWAGLWRYSIDDRIRVIDRMGESPVFEFLSRGQHTASITGEKITEHQVVEAMRSASASMGRHVDRFVVQGRFADTPYYELRVEGHELTDLHSLASAMDSALGELNIEYAAKRKTGRLGRIQPIALPTGALEEAEIANIVRRRGRVEQYKHQYLMTDVLTDDAAPTPNA
ncbi:MAG: GH3 auxin-responsive promoter family protein [Planctomycetota bacterium]|jgi:hypothetical protein